MSLTPPCFHHWVLGFWVTIKPVRFVPIAKAFLTSRTSHVVEDALRYSRMIYASVRIMSQQLQGYVISLGHFIVALKCHIHLSRVKFEFVRLQYDDSSVVILCFCIDVLPFSGSQAKNDIEVGCLLLLLHAGIEV